MRIVVVVVVFVFVGCDLAIAEQQPEGAKPRACPVSVPSSRLCAVDGEGIALEDDDGVVSFVDCAGCDDTNNGERVGAAGRTFECVDLTGTDECPGGFVWRVVDEL